MGKFDLKGAIDEHVKEKDGARRLSCHVAHVIAEDHRVALGTIGEICNAAGIRIVNCELGCFGDGKK
jgi:hypothetical protein